MFEPLPLRKTERPPVIPDKVKLAETNATVYMHDIYAGAGLQGVPRGTVKNLRVFQYEYSYRNQGGHYFVGMEGGWDVRRLIGTVPVEEDGSAMFHVPANTPVAVQPLDAEGKALQQMRSWFVGMPGEYVSCVGCHESQNSTRGAEAWHRRAQSAGGARAVARAEARVQFRARGAAGAGQVLRRLPQRPGAGGRTCPTRRSSRPAAASPRCRSPMSNCIPMCGATGRKATTTP